LKGDSGETAATFAGVRDVWFSRQAAFVLADSLVESHGLEVHHPLGVKVGQIVRAGFAVLDASFGEDTLLVVEAGSPIIRCMGLLDFEEKWRFPSNGKRWCFRSAYDKETRAFVTCHESNEGGYELLRFDSQAGSAQSVCKVAAQGSFSGSGGLFVDEGGNCWCARTGQRRKLF
jgi:hypothetical protein